jgi:hypothetical protein
MERMLGVKMKEALMGCTTDDGLSPTEEAVFCRPF